MGYPIGPIVCLDSNGNLLRSAVGRVYAMEDTDFANPVAVTDMGGVPMDPVSTNGVGILPEMIQRDLRMRWHDGENTVLLQTVQDVERQVGEILVQAQQAAASAAAAAAATPAQITAYFGADMTGLSGDLATKADLVDGKVPSSQLPAMSGGSGTGSIAQIRYISGAWYYRDETAGAWVSVPSTAPTGCVTALVQNAPHIPTGADFTIWSGVYYSVEIVTA